MIIYDAILRYVDYILSLYWVCSIYLYLFPNYMLKHWTWNKMNKISKTRWTFRRFFFSNEYFFILYRPRELTKWFMPLRIITRHNLKSPQREFLDANYFATLPSSSRFKLIMTRRPFSIPLCSGPVFCLLLGVSSDYAQPITGQVTEVTYPVIGWAQPGLTLSKRQKTGPDLSGVVT